MVSCLLGGGEFGGVGLGRRLGEDQMDLMSNEQEDKEVKCARQRETGSPDAKSGWVQAINT